MAACTASADSKSANAAGTTEGGKQMNVNTPIEDHCCKAMERCTNILIEKRYINGQERWMWERVKKSGKIGANEIIFCPYCGNDLNHHAQQPNEPLTMEQQNCKTCQFYERTVDEYPCKCCGQAYTSKYARRKKSETHEIF